ncbi:MAG: hypothetical protein SPL69_11015 [Succinivibrionaceae bacterium]|nr:hypothetical protein [Succinivibrionaceae bacterium]
MGLSQPSWSRYEAAILLDGYLAVLNGKLSRKDAVSRVSHDLRQMAVRQGIAIDGIYRNENGIHFQMKSMESAWQGHTVSKPATRLFSEVADLYKNNRHEFETVLSEAKAMAETGQSGDQTGLLHSGQDNSPTETVPAGTDESERTEKKDFMLLRYPITDLFFYSYTQPFDVEYAGTHYTVRNWKQAYVQVVKCLFNDFPEKIYDLKGKALRGSGSIDIADAADALRTPREIAENLFLETNESADDIVTKIGMFLEICGIGADKVFISYYPSRKKDTPEVGTDSRHTSKSDFDGVDFAPYREILSRFPRGFRISSILDMKRFRSFWKEKYGEELLESDDIVRKYVEHITIPYNNLVYLPEMMLSESASDALQSYLARCFDEGKTAVYFDALYKEFHSEFENSHINNPGMLKTYLAHVYKGKYFLHRSYITAVAGVEVDPAVEVREYMIAAGLPVTKDDLKSEFSYIDERELIRVIQGTNSAEFVRNQQGEYFHADIVKFSQQEMDTIRGLIQSAIADKDYMGGKELIDSIASRLPEINERYPFLTPFGLRDAIAYKLRDEFSFKGKIISTYGQDLSMTDVFAHFASVHEHFTLDQLNSLKLDLNTPIYFDPVYENSLRVSMDDFVSRNQARFDVDATDDAISRFCTGDYIALKNISFFGSFPDAGFPWNVFLLEHYVASFSKKYKLLHLNFIASTPAGAIVSRSSNFDNFDDVLANELAKSNIPLDAESSLQYLVDTGFLARKRYTGIEQVLMRAKQQRASLSD